ncbi:MAG: glycerol-3-phosphate 1-O-acyltransferase PlsY [Gemmatimonadota bacterium]
MTGELALWIVASYLLGAIPTSFLAARYLGGVDLRRVGSGNLGATNLYRALGWRFAVPVGLVDAAKGAIPVLVFAPRAGGGVTVALLLGACAIAGHVFSVFVGFKGGKGVATSAGALLGLAPLALLVALAVWAVVVGLTRYVSLGSILAAAVFPVAVAWFYPGSFEVLVFSIGLAGLIIAFHQANVRRLLAGTESRFGTRSAPGAGQ